MKEIDKKLSWDLAEHIIQNSKPKNLSEAIYLRKVQEAVNNLRHKSQTQKGPEIRKR